MKDWFCHYQFDKRFAQESAKCPHRSKELEEGVVLVRDHDGLACDLNGTLRGLDGIELHAGLTHSWREISCYACNACEGQCPIERKCIEERFGSLVNYELWLQKSEERQRELEMAEAQREGERKKLEIRGGPMILTIAEKTYELDKQLEEQFLQVIVGNISETDFFKALKRGKAVS